MTENLKAFCIIYIVTTWVILSSVNSKSTQNWKQKRIIWNYISSPEISKPLNCFLRTFIILWLVCLYCSNKNLFFVNLRLFLRRVSIFWLESLYIFPKLQRPALKVHILCKTSIYSWSISEKVSLMHENSFPIHFLCNLKYMSLYFTSDSMKTSGK